ncbi:putative ribonuclease H-like domain-containing protein [Tanacetum coccineum]
MIKYSFGQDEEYVVVKEDKYEDLTSTSEDACRTYQEIFRIMDEEWMITDKSKKGLGYSAVPPPHPLIYNRPKKLDLSYSGLDEFKEPEFKGYGSENSEQESNVVCHKKSDNSKENSDESFVEEQVSQDTSSFVESSLNVDKETVFPVDKKVEFTKSKNHEKPVKKSVSYAKMYRSQTPRGNQRNWNGQKSNHLGKDFVMYNKACFICGSFNHLQINCDHHLRKGIVSRNNYNRVDYDYYAKTTHPHVHRNMTPREVLLKTGLTSLNTVRPVNTAHPKSAVHSAKSMSHFSKQAQSTAQRPFFKQITLTRRSGKPQQDDKGFVKSRCLKHMTGNIAYLSDFKEFNGGYVAFGRGAYGGRITDTFKIPRKDNMYSFDMKNIVSKEILTCLIAKATSDESMLWHRRLGHINFKNINKLFKDNLDETSEILKNFIKEIENLVDKKVKIIRSDNGTEFKNKVMDDFCREKGIKREYSVARSPQQNGVAERRNKTLIEAARTISKAFRVYNTRTKRVEENLHIGFLENKPMIEGNGPKWLFDIDSLSQSMNYVPGTAGTVSNDSADTSEENSQDCIVMPIWKDGSYFDSPTKNVDNGEPKTADDAQKQVEDGLNNENVEQERFADESSSKDVNAVRQQVNTASLDVNTGSLELNDVGPSVSTASSNEEDSTE